MGVDKTSSGFFWIIFLPLPEMPECQPGQNEGGEEKANVISNQHFVHSHNVILKVRGSEPKVVICKNLKLHPSLLANRL